MSVERVEREERKLRGVIRRETGVVRSHCQLGSVGDELKKLIVRPNVARNADEHGVYLSLGCRQSLRQEKG